MSGFKSSRRLAWCVTLLLVAIPGIAAGQDPAPESAQLLSPAPGSTLTASSVMFEWTAGTLVSRYALYVGSGGAGSYDIYASQLSGLSAAVSGLPTDGSTVYVRLWSYVGVWQYRDYTYKATTFSRAHLTSPVPGSTLGGSGVTFEWSAGLGVSRVALYVGTEGPGSYDVYFASQGTKLSAAVPNLPVDGRTVYVRLWSDLGGRWQYEDYLYTAATGSAQLMTPAPGSTLTSSTVTFGWIESVEVSEVAIYVGTMGPGSYNLYAAFHGKGLSATVTGLPVNGGWVYVRLWSYLRGQWQYNDYTYRTSPSPAAGVRLTSPEPGSTFTSTTVTFAWTTNSDASLVALYVGTGGVGSYDLYSGYHNSTPPAVVAGLPADGRTIYVRLWFFIGGSWNYNDYIYNAAMGAAQLTTPAPWSTLTESTVTFGWSVGEGVSAVALYVGIGGVGSYDIYSAIQDPSGSATVSGLPTNGETVYVRLWSLTVEGWQYGDYTYTASR